MNKYIKALIKVTSKYEYAEDFRNGKLWMNELRYFTKCEEEELRDPYEARGTTISVLNHDFNIIYDKDLCHPVFCLYGVYDAKYGNTGTVSIAEKMKAFGQYAVVVTDVEKFTNRLRDASLIFSPIRYYEPDYADPSIRTPYMAYFCKKNYFKYQSEFRIVNDNLLLVQNTPEKYNHMKTLSSDHDVVQIAGGLSDITSSIIPVEELLFPNCYHVLLSVNWEKVRFQDYVLYEKPQESDKL